MSHLDPDPRVSSAPSPAGGRSIDRVVVERFGARWVAVVGVVAAAVLGAAGFPFRGGEALALAAGAAVLAALWVRPVWWTAVLWGAVLPIDVFIDLSSDVLDGWRFLGALALVVRVGADADLRRGPLPPWLAAIGALALFRTGVAVLQDDRSSLVVGASMLTALVPAAFVAARRPLHRPVLLGYLVGATASGFVSMLQAAELALLRPGPSERLRYPGLASKTSVLTWQMALAVVIGAYLLQRSRQDEPVSWWAGAVSVPICTFALLTCGSQGGLLALALVVVLLGPQVLRSISRRQLGASAALVVVGLVLAGVAVLTLDIDGIPPEKGFVNETTRVDIGRDAVREIGQHPLLGTGHGAFVDEYGILPHTVPLETGVSAGLVGLGLGLYLVWLLARTAFLGRRGDGWAPGLGASLAAVMLVSALVEPSGPFIGLNRTTILLIAVVAVGRLAPRARVSPGRAVPTRR